MTMTTMMNLTLDPWIPVLRQDGNQRLVSITEAFACAETIRDISAKPHEKIALLRLLICIAQAALDGPKDFNDWETCMAAIPKAAQEYLVKWRESFELFGEGQRFLQVPGLRMGKEDAEGNPATKLDITLATGNGATIFDNAGGSDRPLCAARLALALLTFQCFSPGGRIGVAKWNGTDTPGAGSSNHAPCIPSGMLHTFIVGGNLLETLHWNLLNKEEGSDLGGGGWGKPVWEEPVSALSDKVAIANAVHSYLGRMVPLSRAIRLTPEGRSIVLGNGLDYPLYPIFREPAATLVERKEGPGILGVSLGRSLWRQLSAITVKRRSRTDKLSGSLALNNLVGTEAATLWIGALATDKAKIEDVVEAAYDIPAEMFRDSGRKLYEAGVALADVWSQALSFSVKAYASALKLEPPPYDRARQRFWTAIEQHVPILLRLAGKPEDVGPLPESGWGHLVRTTAQEAYEATCPHQTPRQIEAYAIGRQQLHLTKPKDASKPATKTPKNKPTSTTK